MYAVIRTGGKQYKVKAGDLLRVEKLEKNLGEEFDLGDVIFVSGESSHFGSPLVKDAKVTVVVTNQSKNPKIIIFKRRRRQGYRRLTGHRQPFTELFIKSIVAPNGEKVVTDKTAPVIDPAKKAARVAKAKEEAKTAPKSEAKSKTTKKVAAKKKTAAKKPAAKKTTAKKKK
ncbi:MAG: 50S ribosomal protein L21 [Bdellovibrionaceae bacterium]|nr:50S ribosomal protein L21 [Pseudobdellovibrionaceae bacterium]